MAPISASMELRGRDVRNTLGLFTHTSTYINVTADEYNTLSQQYQENFISEEDGSYSCTVSGFEGRNSSTPFDTYLDLRYNDESDIGATTFISDVVSETKDTMTLINDYLNQALLYTNNETNTDYDWFPNDSDEGNCNALQGSIYDNIGATVLNVPSNATGFDHRIGGGFFE